MQPQARKPLPRCWLVCRFHHLPGFALVTSSTAAPALQPALICCCIAELPDAQFGPHPAMAGPDRARARRMHAQLLRRSRLWQRLRSHEGRSRLSFDRRPAGERSTCKLCQTVYTSALPLYNSALVSQADWRVDLNSCEELSPAPSPAGNIGRCALYIRRREP